jgi:hypothetical protein
MTVYVCMYVFNTSATYILGKLVSRVALISAIVLSHLKILYVLYVCTYVILQQGSFPHLGLAVEEWLGSLSVLLNFFYFFFLSSSSSISVSSFAIFFASRSSSWRGRYCCHQLPLLVVEGVLGYVSLVV